MIIFSIALIMILGACDTSPDDDTNSLFTAGEYSDYAQGQMSRITIAVTFSADKIDAVAITQHNESIDRESVAEALKVIPQRIVEKQSLVVDTVSGATVCSKGIIVAVEKCAKQAGGDAAVAALKK
jgi:fumarate reductase flavoprotein subunit